MRSLITDLDLADEIAFEPEPGPFTVVCEGLGLSERENLAWRAVSAVTPRLEGWRIRVCKRIPLQAGLGGGSADAAAVLRGLARIHEQGGKPISIDELQTAAAGLGSDVPACLIDGLKEVGGTGESVRPIPAPAPLWGVLLLQPTVRVATAHAYRLIDEARKRSGGGDFLREPRREGQTETVEALAAAYAGHDFERACALLHNDFQPVIESAFAEIAAARERLTNCDAAAALLCGSGSCVAGLFASTDAAERARALLALRPGEWMAVSRFVDGA